MIDYFEGRWIFDQVTYTIAVSGSGSEQRATLTRSDGTDQLGGAPADVPESIAGRAQGLRVTFPSNGDWHLTGEKIGVIKSGDDTSMAFWDPEFRTKEDVKWTKA